MCKSAETENRNEMSGKEVISFQAMLLTFMDVIIQNTVIDTKKKQCSQRDSYYHVYASGN